MSLSRSSPSALFVFCGGTLALISATGLLGRLEPLALVIIGLSTVIAFAVSTVLRRPSLTWPWIAITVGLALFLVSGAARASMHPMGNLTATRPLLPDLIAIPGYGLLAAGLLGFSRRSSRLPVRQSSLVLDGLIAGLALAALAWVFAIQPVLKHSDAPLLVVLILAAYPSLSVFMVVVTLRIAFNPEQEWVPAFWFLLAGMTLMFLGDVVYFVADMNIVTVPERLLDLPYALAYISAGAAALHASMRALTLPSPQRQSSTSSVRVTVVAAALAIPAVLAAAHPGGALEQRLVLTGLMLLMTAAAVVRIIQALRSADQSEARLLLLANHDGLTGLPNRRMMEEHVSRLLDQPSSGAGVLALLYLDLDRFKLVNDTLGHTHGDALLVEVARRLNEHVRPTDLVARIGGDEFMIVLEQARGIESAVDLANRLLASLEPPIVIAGIDFHVTASAGVAVAEDRATVTTEDLVRDADTAMYQAKDAGRSTVAVFDESMRARITERVELEHDLRPAVALGQLHLVYQPIMHLSSGTVAGMEALVRWRHPRHGLISPAKFIPLAEESGLIREIGDWVLDTAAGQLASWRQQGAIEEGLYVSVNVSGVQLHDRHILDRVAEVLAVHGLDGSSLCLELTESVVMEDPQAAAHILAKLRRLGVRLSIDDFGSEYSSLAYLKRLPVTELKIDKAFVDTLEQGGADATLIATIVAMAEALGLTTVAEGVETHLQAERLLDVGCSAVQGYLYSRPVGARRLPEVVAALSAPRLHVVEA